MNILQISKYYHPHIGGIESIVQDIAEGVKNEHNSRVLSSNPQGLGSHVSHNGVDVIKTASLGTLLSVPISPQFPLRLQQLRRRADIVHYHLPNPLSVMSHLLLPPNDTPLVATYHSDIVRQSRAMSMYRPFLHKFLKRTDRILVTSPRLVKHSSELKPYQAKCTVVPLSINVKQHQSVSSRGRFETTEPLILFVGRLSYYKGVEYLIRSMHNIDANLLIIGEGEKSDELHSLSKELDLDKKVSFEGHVSEEELGHAYEAADVFVLPSTEPSEAFGIVQLEAMAHGLPIVNTSLPTGVPWVSQDGKTGITVTPKDSAALANAISTLLTNDDLRRTYGHNARKRVEKRFSSHRMISDVSDVYQSITDSSNGCRSMPYN